MSNAKRIVHIIKYLMVLGSMLVYFLALLMFVQCIELEPNSLPVFRSPQIFYAKVAPILGFYPYGTLIGDVNIWSGEFQKQNKM